MQKPELTALTGIRYFAAFCVFLSHVRVIPGMSSFGGDSLLFDLGVVGVSFFFVLSGFILTYNYSDSFSDAVSPAQYGRFVWDRATKIFPLQWATLAVMIPVQLYSPNLPLDWRAVPFHALLSQCLWPFSSPPWGSYLNVPSWSISCEWFFYLVAPVCMLCAQSRRFWWLPLALAVVGMGALDISLSHASLEAQFYFVYNFAPSRIVEFLTGILLAKAFAAQATPQEARSSSLFEIGGFVALGIGALLRRHAPWPLHGGLLYVPGSLLIIAGLSSGRGPIASFLGNRWLRQLGMASFSFYLIHVPMLRITKGICMKFGWAVHSWSTFILVGIVMYSVIQCAALLTYRWFEWPAQKSLRRWVSRTPHSVPKLSAT